MTTRHRVELSCFTSGLRGAAKLVLWSALVCGLCVRPTSAQEVLTLTGDNPNVAFVDDTANPDQKWQILANVAGFKVRDITDPMAVTEPFTLDLGLPTNALRVTKDANGDTNVGIGGIATGARHLHIRSTNGTVNIKMDKTLEPQRSWTIFAGSNNFGVQDDNASSVPFQIDVGTPTGTLVLDSTGRVGIGAIVPDANSRLDIRSSLLNGLLAKRADANAHFLRVENSVSAFRCGVQGNGDTQFGALTSGKGLNLLAGGTGKVAINASGQISFGNVPPVFTTDALVHQTGARLTNVGVWTDASSRALKQDIEPITSEQARETVRALQPVGYRYKAQPEEPYVGFIAEDVPELVATSDRKSLAPMDIVAVLTKVVQDQQTLLDAQQKKLEKLEQQEATIATLMERLDAIERANAVAPRRD